MYFNIKKLKTIFNLGIHKYLKKKSYNDFFQRIKYFIKSKYTILNYFNKDYIDQLIDYYLEFKLTKIG